MGDGLEYSISQTTLEQVGLSLKNNMLTKMLKYQPQLLNCVCKVVDWPLCRFSSLLPRSKKAKQAELSLDKVWLDFLILLQISWEKYCPLRIQRERGQKLLQKTTFCDTSCLCRKNSPNIFIFHNLCLSPCQNYIGYNTNHVFQIIKETCSIDAGLRCMFYSWK